MSEESMKTPMMEPDVPLAPGPSMEELILQGSEKKKNILLMYISKVSGHRQATAAIRTSLKQLDSRLEIPSVNGFGYTFPKLEKLVNRAYMSVIRRTPQVWDYLYDNPRVFKMSGSVKKLLSKSSHAKITRLMEKYRPDTVVCTQAFPCGLVADYKIQRKQQMTLIGVLTDYAPHAYWINEGVDYYVVPSAEARDRFIRKGVPPDAIKVYGIPIRMKFSCQLDKLPILRKLGLDPEVPVVLIMGGGQGLGPIKETVAALNRIESPVQMIVLTGVNNHLIQWLKEQSPRMQKKILFYEYVNNVDELMEIATLIITKPGGMTTSECLAKGLPMVIINPIPGQEMRNTDFLIQKGIGIRIDNPDEVGDEVELLLKSPERIASMREAAYRHGKPHAALDIARLILDH